MGVTRRFGEWEGRLDALCSGPKSVCGCAVTSCDGLLYVEADDCRVLLVAMSRDSQDTHLSPAHRPNTPNHKRPSDSGHSDHPQQSSSAPSTSIVSHSSDSNSNHLRSNNGLSSAYVSIFRAWPCRFPSDGPDLSVPEHVRPVENPCRVPLFVHSAPCFI